MDLKIKKLAKKIKIILTDVDGVLTDGGRYYSGTGEQLKKFHVRDGMAVNILLRNNIKTLILTKEKSSITKKWAKDMNVTQVFAGYAKKENALNLICKKYKVSLENLAYIGDDVNDLNVLRKVGLSAAPKNADSQVKKIVNFTCKNKAGDACFREFIEIILFSKYSSDIKWY